MSNENANAAAQTTRPAMEKKIDKTTYRVTVHFSETSNETLDDKIKRLLRSEIQGQ